MQPIVKKKVVKAKKTQPVSPTVIKTIGSGDDKTKPATVKLPAKKPKTLTPVDLVASLYKENQWIVMIVGGMNNIIAQKNNKLHFVQVVTCLKSTKYNGIARNEFIQNAFTNDATPIHAIVTDQKVEFINVNINEIVKIAPKPKDKQI